MPHLKRAASGCCKALIHGHELCSKQGGFCAPSACPHLRASTMYRKPFSPTLNAPFLALF